MFFAPSSLPRIVHCLIGTQRAAARFAARRYIQSMTAVTAARPSASLIVVNPRNEILLVHRNPKSTSFAGMHVFPGGNYDKVQDSSFAVTAIRETFEETGLLLASSLNGSNPLDAELNEAREDIYTNKKLFSQFLASHSLSSDTEALLPFTQWITPPNVPKRFHTQFYVAFLNAGPSAGFSEGDKLDRLPTPDGGQEVIAARFVHPEIALKEFETKRIALMPPQYYLITTLASILTGNTNTEDQRKRVKTLSNGAFGRMVINPRSSPQGAPEGWSILTYEGDETRGGSKGRLHRSLVKFVKGGGITDIVLQRNFDIFCEIEEKAFQNAHKL